MCYNSKSVNVVDNDSVFVQENDHPTGSNSHDSDMFMGLIDVLPNKQNVNYVDSQICGVSRDWTEKITLMDVQLM